MDPTWRSQHDGDSVTHSARTLDLMVLTTLEQLGPLHGHGIARRIDQVAQDALIVNQEIRPER